MTHQDQAPRTEADEHTDEQRRKAARQHVQQLQAFYVHASVFAGGMVIIFLVNLTTNLAAGIAGEWSAWWSAWAFIGWSLGVGVHGLVLALNRPARPSSSWAQERIDEVMAR